MADGDDKDDLFEDLDKFFAPIQDVDWPEPSGSAPAGSPPPSSASEAAPGQEDEPSFSSTDASAEEGKVDEQASPFEEPIRVGDTLKSETVDLPSEEPMSPTEPATPSWPSGTEDEAETGEDVGSFLFASEGGDEADDEEEAAADLSVDAFSQAPEAYVDLPDAEGEDDVAELDEGHAVASEEPPSREAIEAAAEHFAESVREEVRVEPVERASTEPVDAGLAGLLAGPEGIDESALPDLEEPSLGQRTVRVGGEGLGGPSWQEPTAVEVGPDHEGRSAGRDVPLAFLTGLVLAGLALGAIAIGTGPFAILAGLVVLFAQGELYLALQKRHYQPATALGLVAGALVLGAGYYRGEAAMIAMVGLSTFATFLWFMATPAQHRRDVVTNVALTVFGIVYIPMLAGYVFSVLRLSDGRGLGLSIIGLTFAYDTAAFAVGYLSGSRPLAPTISPKKSWEGAIGATLVVMALSVGVVANSVPSLDTFAKSIGLAVVVALFAPLGDLAESLLKRDLQLKDMGSILPGHGGVLDRIDSVLFVAPAAFLFLRLIFP
ncbi:MAG: phosphatidate cytidylyltransferase [Actinomycetota bacterium]